MPINDIIRAWKDEEYRNSLSEEQKAQLPADPAGIVDVADEELNGVVGGFPFPTKRCGHVPTVTADCRCGWTLTGRCKCPGITKFIC